MKFCKSDNQDLVHDFLEALPTKDVQKVVWVLRLAEESTWIPVQYFFPDPKDDNLWEIRISVGLKNYWLLAFKYQDEWVLCNADFSTKTQKAFQEEKLAARLQAENYKAPFQFLTGSDLDKYIKKKKKDETFAEGFEEGYLLFKIGAILRQVRQKAGLTQAEIAVKLDMSSTVISRIENHAEELDIEVLESYVKDWTKKLSRDLAAN